MGDFPTQKLDPKFKYCATNFKIIADFGAASTHGGRHCVDCKHCQHYSECHHPCLAKPFKLGAQAERMGCRNGWEAEEGSRGDESPRTGQERT